MNEADQPLPHAVRGERGTTLVDRASSLQSRLSSILAMGLMTVLGLGALTWYYANAVLRPSHARQAAQAAAANRAQGDMPLPALGRIDPPLPVPAAAQLPTSPPPLMTSSPLSEVPLVVGTNPGAQPTPPPKTPAELALERQMSGVVFAAQRAAPAASAPAPAESAPPGTTQDTGSLSTLLRPSLTTAVRAQLLPSMRLLLPKGAFIDCTLETAIDSTLPGMTTCITATDTFGVDGKVVLLERGTKLVGETKGQVQQGAARVFVLWTEARTPTGVVVPLASPGADELGRSGLPGTVNRHFWERFGAAMLVTVIDGAVQTAVQSSRSGNGTVILDPSASQGVMTEVLKSTVGIAPTVVKQQGDRIAVLVARDLDFRSVYELQSAAPR
jgi:type IV secretion system protein VirB10